MNRPKNWENTQVYGEFEKLELGGHICRIMKVEETLSQAGNNMLKIYIDIAAGKQKDYYSNLYKNSTRENKKWGCIVYQLTEDKDGNTHRGFKTFIDSVEKSNKGFNVDKIWDEHFCDYFKDKLIGGVFGREQYVDSSGELKWSIKCVSFKDIETIKNGVAVPDDKYVAGAAPSRSSAFASDPSTYEGTFSEDDDDLPF